MKKVKILCLIVVMLLVVGFGSMVVDAEEKPLEGKRIAVAHISLYDEWTAASRDALVELGEELGAAEINVQSAEFTHEVQVTQVENFITQQYDVIFIDVVNSEAIKHTLEKAYDAGIPVIAFDSGTTWDKLISHIAWDHEETGKMMGEYVVNYIEDELDGKANVAILDMQQYTHTAIRAEAFRNKIEAMGDGVNIVTHQDFMGDAEIASNIIANTSEEIDVVYSVVDNGCWGAVSTLESENDKNAKVFSSGAYGDRPFSALRNEHEYYYAAVVVDPYILIQDTYDAYINFLAGKDVPRDQNIELLIVDQNNIDEYYPE